MKVHHTTVTRNGQITVPKEVREALCLREGDRVNIIQRDGRVEIERAGGVVARTAGIFGGRAASMTAEALREAAEQAIAEGAVEGTVSGALRSSSPALTSTSLKPGMTDRTNQPVHVRTYGVAAPRAEPIDLDLARREFAESRLTAYLKLDDDTLPDQLPEPDVTSEE